VALRRVQSQSGFLSPDASRDAASLSLRTAKLLVEIRIQVGERLHGLVGDGIKPLEFQWSVQMFGFDRRPHAIVHGDVHTGTCTVKRDIQARLLGVADLER
jgi:hypothetical protein